MYLGKAAAVVMAIMFFVILPIMWLEENPGVVIALMASGLVAVGLLVCAMWAIHAAQAERAAAEQAALAAPETQRLRRNAASKEKAVMFGGAGAFLGGIVLGVGGCVSCGVNFQSRALDGPVITDFNLFSGLLYGAIIGAVIGVFLEISIGQSKGEPEV